MPCLRLLGWSKKLFFSYFVANAGKINYFTCVIEYENCDFIQNEEKYGR